MNPDTQAVASGLVQLVGVAVAAIACFGALVLIVQVFRHTLATYSGDRCPHCRTKHRPGRRGLCDRCWSEHQW